MKNPILILVAMYFSLPAFSQADRTIGLNDAIKQNLITVSGMYNGNSVHYLNPVTLNISNHSKRSLKLKIEAGNIMEPEDSGCQTMMVTGDMFVLLKSGETKTAEPYGMCTEPSDRAGSKGLKYSYKTNHNLKLIEIAKFINDNKYNDGVGQTAVWCVADKGRNLLEINGYDSLSRLKLISRVAQILGKPVPDARSLRQGYSDYTKPKMTETIGGKFEFTFSKTKKVHVAMFNARGTLVRELYYNPQEAPGLHKVNFEFDYTVYTDEYYDIKLIADDEVLLSSRLDRNEDHWIEEE